MESNACSPRCIQDVVWPRNGTLEDDAIRIYIWQSENLALKVKFCVPIAPKFEVDGHHLQDQDSLLVKRRNDNHSPGPVIRELVPSSHQRSELSNTILSIFSG